MAKQVLDSTDASVQPSSWCVEWFGSQGDFIAGKAKEPISLNRFAGLESLYAIGPLERGHGVIITSSITMEAAKDLKIKKGDTAYAIIKASEVIVGKD